MSDDTINIRRSDLEKLRDGIVDGRSEWTQTGPWQSTELACSYCGATNPLCDDFDDIKHDPDCIYLIARDICPRDES